MANIELVVKIPCSLYANLSKIKHGTTAAKRTLECTQKGTPLPKGHGRLIDADALWKEWVFDAIGKQEIEDAPTIIEADKEKK